MRRKFYLFFTLKLSESEIKKRVPMFFLLLQKRQDRFWNQNLKSLWVQRHILLYKNLFFFQTSEKQ
ncbi:hypothetical protein EGI11_09075 [Chryseobacterium sp. H3056]|uniref:Uncharacterized protein n=1 Tax=Kaistella daneshvariae TaxID=2487074 RepID=A0A3N0WRU4_9FLAO|nr:hypothetical protein EGI11_09075 [Kaistella daneshvariae]